MIDKFEDDIPKYRKASNAKTPKKSKHKHLAEPCVLRYPIDWYQKEHLRTGEMKEEIGYYCPICGKLMGLKEKDRWYTTRRVANIPFAAYEVVSTEEGERELNPETRTLPTFDIQDRFDNLVDLS